MTPSCLGTLGQESINLGSSCPVLSHYRKGPKPFMGQTSLQQDKLECAV